MEVRPILSAMFRNKVGAVLVALQIAVTLTVLSNALFIVYKRVELMTRDTGFDVMNTFGVSNTVFAPGANVQDVIDEDLRQLNAMPNVVSASSINNFPLSGGGWGQGFSTENTEDAPRTSGNVYAADENIIETLGVKMIAGRDFRRDEIIMREPAEGGFPEKAIISKAMAEAVFEDWESALGQTMWQSIYPAEVIGIYEKMQGAWVGWDGLERTVLVPQRNLESFNRYMIRTEPGTRDATMAVVEEKLAEINDGRIVGTPRSIEEMRARSYRSDRAMAILLISVVVVLTVVAGLGIVGLASFTVSQRRKQIGTRRALGARKWDVVRYFLVENWLITSMGVALGAAMAVGVNYWLVHEYEMQPIDWFYIPGGILALWLLGQLAVIGPAKRASNVPPAVATRSV